MEQATQKEQAQGKLPTTLNVPLSILTNTFNGYAKRAVTRADKHYLFGIVEGLGTAIVQQNIRGPNAGSGGANGGGFTLENWMTECGVSPDWATIAA
jgi:hypothetical protein